MQWHSFAEFFAMGGYGLYVWGSYGVAAVLTVFHDTLITVGAFSLLNWEISLTVIAARSPASASARLAREDSDSSDFS